MKPSEMASLSNSRWKNCKELPIRSTNNGDMTYRANRYVLKTTKIGRKNSPVTNLSLLWLYDHSCDHSTVSCVVLSPAHTIGASRRPSSSLQVSCTEHPEIKNFDKSYEN